MTDKSNFTPEEWRHLRESVMMAGVAVKATEPSGRLGFARGNLCRWQRAEPDKDRVRGRSAQQGSGRRLRNRPRPEHPARWLEGKALKAERAEIKAQFVGALRQARALVDPIPARNQPARCEAANEGGFLCIDSVPVSDAEKATLTEVLSPLGPGT